ncbi:UDP-N-acetylglucosamine 2-epimerase [bacterium]|nr:UDP-N-acetylglucosamine 2-epimerase [bacterium]
MGTRPEAIKTAPLAAALRAVGQQPRWVLTGQHPGLERFLALWGEGVDAVPPLPPGSLTGRLAGILAPLGTPPGPVVVQGDTLSTLAGALWAFYSEKPLSHLEAGLRTARLDRPFPEEAHRRLVARLATLHLAPTTGARKALLAEGVAASAVEVVGNTVVDALLTIRKRHPAAPPAPRGWLEAPRRVLVTCHRRENRAALPRLLANLASFAKGGQAEVLFVLHPSHDQDLARDAGLPSIPAAPYPGMLALVAASTLVLTDSGGLQEEAPALGVPVAVLREETERVEGLAAGVARLAPPASFPECLDELLAWAEESAREPAFPYGGRGAAKSAAAAILARFIS